MFKLKEFESSEIKQDVLLKIKSSLESLTQCISVLKSAKVSFNINPKEQWDIVLECEFNTFEDLETYIIHPEHVRVGNELVKPNRTDRACVDYVC